MVHWQIRIQLLQRRIRPHLPLLFTSTFDVGRSMFDVLSPSHLPAQLMLHELERRLLDEVVFGVGGHASQLSAISFIQSIRRLPQVRHLPRLASLKEIWSVAC